MSKQIMKSMSTQQSTLYVVATPIGNMGDISQRAIEILQAVDLVCAEDTRHTRQLFNHLDINNELLSLHEHNERERTDLIIQKMHSGQSLPWFLMRVRLQLVIQALSWYGKYAMPV